MVLSRARSITGAWEGSWNGYGWSECHLGPAHRIYEPESRPAIIICVFQTPIWYEVYEAFPPKHEPRWDREPSQLPVPRILYQEVGVSSQQWCGSGSASFWLPESASNKNSDPYPRPDPHQSDTLDPEPDPDPHPFADDKPKCTEYEPILALFQRFEPLLGS